MPSEYSNLNFVAKWDIANWRQKCEEQRKVALQWPAYDPRMSAVEEYGWKIGPWSVRLCLEIWKKPYVWHASAAIFEHIAYETVAFDKGPMAGAKVEVPQDALLAVSSWVEEHHEQARFLMGEMLGPYLTPGDKHQPAQEFDGLWCKHWSVRYDGPETWKRNQN